MILNVNIKPERTVKCKHFLLKYNNKNKIIRKKNYFNG